MLERIAIFKAKGEYVAPADLGQPCQTCGYGHRVLQLGDGGSIRPCNANDDCLDTQSHPAEPPKRK